MKLSYHFLFVLFIFSGFLYAQHGSLSSAAEIPPASPNAQTPTSVVKAQTVPSVQTIRFLAAIRTGYIEDYPDPTTGSGIILGISSDLGYRVGIGAEYNNFNAFIALPMFFHFSCFLPRQSFSPVLLLEAGRYVGENYHPGETKTFTNIGMGFKANVTPHVGLNIEVTARHFELDRYNNYKAPKNLAFMLGAFVER